MTEIELIAVAPAVELMIVTVFVGAVVSTGTPPKPSELGLAATVAPLPVRLTVRGLPAASSVIVSVPGLEPVAVGVNVTLTVQPAPAASVAGASGQPVVIA